MQHYQYNKQVSFQNLINSNPERFLYLIQKAELEILANLCKANFFLRSIDKKTKSIIIQIVQKNANGIKLSEVRDNYSFFIRIIPKMLDMIKLTQFSFLIDETLNIFRDFEIKLMDIMVQNNCAEVLLQLIHSTNYQLIEQVAMTITTLCCNEIDFAEIVKKNHIIELLINFIWKQQEEKNQKIALRILPSILETIWDDDQTAQLISELRNLLNTYSKLMKYSNDVDILRLSCEGISIIAEFQENLFIESEIAILLIEMMGENKVQSVLLEVIYPLIIINRSNKIYSLHLYYLGFIAQIEKLIGSGQIEPQDLDSILSLLIDENSNLLSRIVQSKIIISYLFQGLKSDSSKTQNNNSIMIIAIIIKSKEEKDLEQLISYGLFNQLIESLFTSCHIENTITSMKLILKLLKYRNCIYKKMIREIQGELLFATKYSENQWKLEMRRVIPYLKLPQHEIKVENGELDFHLRFLRFDKKKMIEIQHVLLPQKSIIQSYVSINNDMQASVKNEEVMKFLYCKRRDVFSDIFLSRY